MPPLAFDSCGLCRKVQNMAHLILLFGRYHFLQLPFGITPAPEVSHKTMHVIYECVEGADPSMEDIIAWGSTRKGHDLMPQKVLETARTAHLK